MIGSAHWVSGQASLPPTATGSMLSAFALSIAPVKSSHVVGLSTLSFSAPAGVYQMRLLTLPLK